MAAVFTPPPPPCRIAVLPFCKPPIIEDIEKSGNVRFADAAASTKLMLPGMRIRWLA